METKTLLLAAPFAIALMAGVFYSSGGGDGTKASENSSGPDSEYIEIATFAGGCFWCMEPPFEKLDGVRDVVSGYAGGDEEDPTYAEVSSGKTGHVEAVQVFFNPEIVSYEELLDVFWRQIDPTDDGGQFVDRGHQYSTAIFFHNEKQEKLAHDTKNVLEKTCRFDKPIATPIIKFSSFYPAEDYHQDFHETNPVRYRSYRNGSGRDRFIEDAWGKDVGCPIMKTSKEYERPSDGVLRTKLTGAQYRVVRENGTEPPFDNEFWDNKKEGIYVDVVSGEPLFSSTDKFKSGTGWPSFTKPLEASSIVQKTDKSHGATRTEVRSGEADSHLGHVFDDGPQSTGLRYCINSASLRFIPKSEMEKEGYSRFLELFE